MNPEQNGHLSLPLEEIPVTENDEKKTSGNLESYENIRPLNGTIDGEDQIPQVEVFFTRKNKGSLAEPKRSLNDSVRSDESDGRDQFKLFQTFILS